MLAAPKLPAARQPILGTFYRSVCDEIAMACVDLNAPRLPYSACRCWVKSPSKDGPRLVTPMLLVGRADEATPSDHPKVGPIHIQHAKLSGFHNNDHVTFACCAFEQHYRAGSHCIRHCIHGAETVPTTVVTAAWCTLYTQLDGGTAPYSMVEQVSTEYARGYSVLSSHGNPCL